MCKKIGSLVLQSILAFFFDLLVSSSTITRFLIMDKSSTLIWFRSDLRLADNSALAAAIELGNPIIPIFIWAPEEAGNWAPGAASKWFLKQSLESLSAEFSKHGGELVLRKGNSLETLFEIIEQTGVNRVFGTAVMSHRSEKRTQ